LVLCAVDLRDDAVEAGGAVRNRIRDELDLRRVAEADLVGDRRAQMLGCARQCVPARFAFDGLAEHRVVRLRVPQIGRHRDIGDRDEPEARVAQALDLAGEHFLDGRTHALGPRVRARPAHASSGDSTFTDACSSSTPGWVSTRRSTSLSIRFAWNTVSAMTETPTVARWRRSWCSTSATAHRNFCCNADWSVRTTERLSFRDAQSGRRKS